MQAPASSQRIFGPSRALTAPFLVPSPTEPVMRTPSNAPGLAILVSAFLLALQSPGAAQSGTRTLKLEDFLDLESAADPQIAPDASRIVFTRQWVDKVNDRRESSLWVMNPDGSKQHQLTAGGGARWSPDGTRIAYVHE